MSVYGRARGYKEEPRRPKAESRASSPIPAPAELAVVQTFLNTFDVKAKSDELASPRYLSDWLSRNGLLPAGTRLTSEDLERARHVRAGLRALVAANRDAEIDPKAVAKLDQAAVGARAQVRFDRDGTSRFELISRDFDDALGTLLGFVHAARIEGKWPAFKLCADPQCRRAFYDFTKSLNGKWCTRRCGDKIRAMAWRRSRKAKGLR